MTTITGKSTQNATSWGENICRLQDVDPRDYNPTDPDLIKATIERFFALADTLTADDVLVDSKIAQLAAEAARINIGETNTARLVDIIATERKVGGGKVAVKKLFAAAKAKLSVSSGQDMGAEWQQRWDDMVEEINADHANVISGGKNLIVRFSNSPITGKRMVEYIPPRELDGMYQHDKYTIGYRDGQPIEKPRITAWVNHPDHRRYEHGVYFLPVAHGMDAQPHDTALNLWTGFGVEPKAGGDWSRIDYHIREVLAAGDDRVYQYLLNWCAYTIQHPDRQAGAVPVFRGLKRTGKGIFANWFAGLWGEHGAMINNSKHLTGQFNGHLEQTCVLFLDEAIYAGDKKHESMLKSLITEPTLMVERKHHDAKQSSNRLKIMMATNERWAVPTSWDDARFCVCDVSDKHKGDRQYFADLAAEMASDDAMQAFMQDMIDRDIDGFHPGDIPQTDGLRDQIRESLDPVWQWWTDVLDAGEIGQGEERAVIGEEHSSKELYSDYLSWCDRMKKGEYSRLSAQGFGREFGEVYSRTRKTAGNYYVIGGVEDALLAFERVKVGVNVDADADAVIADALDDDSIPF